MGCRAVAKTLDQRMHFATNLIICLRGNRNVDKCPVAKVHHQLTGHMIKRVDGRCNKIPRQRLGHAKLLASLNGSEGDRVNNVVHQRASG